MTLQDQIEALLTRWLTPPQAIEPNLTLADLGLRDEATLVSFACDLEEDILDRELPDPAAIHRDMTVRDVVAVVERVLEYV